MQIVLDEKDAVDWVYRGECAANLVLSYSGSSPIFVGKVLRVQKALRNRSNCGSETKVLSAHECLLWNDACKDGNSSVSLDTASQLYVKNVMTPLLGAQHVDAGIHVLTMREFLESVENNISGQRPAWRVDVSKVDAPKRKVKKTNIRVAEHVYGGMVPLDLQKAVEKKFEMALQDRVMEETKDKKNAVESYVYDMRNKLNDKYHDFIIESEKDQLLATLQEVEDWLYEDGEDETKGVYLAKLEELKKQGNPIEQRYKEFTERGPLIDQLVYCINSYRDVAVSNDIKFDHIDIVEKQKVLHQCVEAESWLREKR